MIDDSMRRAARITVLSLAVLGGCGDASDPVPATAFALPATLDGIALDTLFRIGAEQGESWEAFGGIWDVQVSPSGYVAVLDIESGQVHVYDEGGAHVGSVTETGLEPGALDTPSGLAWRGPRDLLVWDPGSSWVSRFSAGPAGVEFVDRWRAFAFGETGFCADGDRTYLSYWQDGLVVHELGPDGPVASFGAAPEIPGMSALGPELQEIGIEELSPSGLLCTRDGVLDVAFFASPIRFSDASGNLRWEREFEDFNALAVYTPDGMGLGRQFDAAEGTHLLQSVVAWGDEYALVQHELRTREFLEEGEIPVVESRLIRLADGVEVDRTRDLPTILAGSGGRLYAVESEPYPRITVVVVAEDPS